MDVDFLNPNRARQGRTYSVAALNREARNLLEQGFNGIWVEAEVVDVTRASSGHVYFSLADPGGAARLSAVMWRGQAMRYGSRIIGGTAIRCRGRITLYEVRGSYQMVVERIEKAGAGTNAQMLEALKKKLHEEGLFDPERKRPLPLYPKCIGVVTSRSGAAFRDIVKVAYRRFPIRIVLAHAQVQGETAPDEIVQALDRIGGVEAVDTVIIGRGGGATEDLDAFNAEAVVRKVAAHPQPVVSAVGHEIDTTLVDLVSDRRAATPSEAAEIAVPDGRALAERIAQSTDDICAVMNRIISTERSRISTRESALLKQDPRVRLRRGVEALTRAQAYLAKWPGIVLPAARALLAEKSMPLSQWPKYALEPEKSQLQDAALSLSHWPGPAIDRYRAELSRLTASLDALSPLASLSRGYSVVRRSKDRAIVRSSEQAPEGTEVEVTLSQGNLICTVDKSTPSDE